MKKETRGRKPLKPEQRKDVTRSVRMTGADLSMLKKVFGSVQVFFDHCLLSEKELQSRKK